MSNRAIVYIDGFNLYYGMKSGNMQKLLWLDLHELAEAICPKRLQVISVKYVTARILNLEPRSSPAHADAEATRKRQSEYIEAVASRGVEVFEGRYKRRRMFCNNCNSSWIKPEEKMSDVHIATQLLCDAFRGNFDTAILVSGDADVTPAVEVVVGELDLPVIAAFPPNRVLAQLEAACSGSIHINKRHIAKSQLPNEFDHEGHTFRRPVKWGGTPPK